MLAVTNAAANPSLILAGRFRVGKRSLNSLTNELKRTIANLPID
ncbi:hypothetical protein NIES2104_18370 [Leptolyngbya sp. NIES-2104]|nr:hypothetical protein NIES2104_18370 [Leptolyngbya sp. NIES-2104]